MYPAKQTTPKTTTVTKTKTKKKTLEKLVKIPRIDNKDHGTTFVIL